MLELFRRETAEDKARTSGLVTIIWISIPEVAETYYSAAAQIDRHNRVRQYDLDMEKTIKVK